MLLTTPADAQRAKKVFAHYLPWYDATGLPNDDRSGWCYPDGTSSYSCTDPSIIHYSNSPLIGEYSQYDDDVLEYHLLTAFVAGIDGFIINLNPQSTSQKNITTQLLNRINTLKIDFPSFDFKIIISYDDSGETNQTIINNNFTYIRDSIYTNAAYSNLVFLDDVGNVPVLLAWSESDPTYYWNTVQTLFGGNVTFMIRNPINFDYSTGNFEWLAYLNTGMPMNNTANWGEQYFQDFDWVMARQLDFGLMNPASVNEVKMGSAYPGFNDQNVPAFWNGGTNRYFHRTVDDGETMALTWQKQIDYTPKRLGGVDCVENAWVQLVTWNDWPEGTSIEPASSGTYGYAALYTTHTKIGEFKGVTPAFAGICLEVPYEIYQARKNNNNTIADQAITALLMQNCTSALSVLPIELSNFKATCVNGTVLLYWQTEQEENSARFEIQSSADGNHWTTIDEMEAMGNSSSLQTYHWQSPMKEALVYMRLKMVDKDEQYQYAPILSIECNSIVRNPFSIFPNPTSELIHIKMDAPTEQSTIQLYDNLGQLIFEKKVEETTLILSKEVLELSSGMYWICLTQNRQIIATEKVSIY